MLSYFPFVDSLAFSVSVYSTHLQQIIATVSREVHMASVSPKSWPKRCTVNPAITTPWWNAFAKWRPWTYRKRLAISTFPLAMISIAGQQLWTGIFSLIHPGICGRKGNSVSIAFSPMRKVDQYPEYWRWFTRATGCFVASARERSPLWREWKVSGTQRSLKTDLC